MLRCEASTDPSLEIEISWFHKGLRLYNSTDHRYTITDDMTQLSINFDGAEDPEISE